MLRTIHTTPARTRTIARWTFNITAPLALISLVWWLFDDTPKLIVCYLSLLFVAVMAAAILFIVAGQLAIHEAFSAGFQTGQASVFPDDTDTRAPDHGRHSRSGRGQDPLLRLVD